MFLDDVNSELKLTGKPIGSQLWFDGLDSDTQAEVLQALKEYPVSAVWRAAVKNGLKVSASAFRTWANELR